MSEPNQHLLIALCWAPTSMVQFSIQLRNLCVIFLLLRTWHLNSFGGNRWLTLTFYQTISADTFNHVSVSLGHIQTWGCTQTHMHETPAHSHACSQSLSDVRAIGWNPGEAKSWCWLLMATASRGAEKDVCNDSVPPSRPALKSSSRPLDAFTLNTSRHKWKSNFPPSCDCMLLQRWKTLHQERRSF